MPRPMNLGNCFNYCRKWAWVIKSFESLKSLRSLETLTIQTYFSLFHNHFASSAVAHFHDIDAWDWFAQ